jgi:TetR/AcrR family transcriptional repressor of nem operon
MPWPEGHKAKTRERIVRAAAEAFRARGIAGVRVEEIMAGAGLTHGGFYAHFASKDELVGPALDHANGETLERLSAAAGTLDGAQRLRAAVDAYLSAAHAAHPERGCPVAALAPEATRAGGRTRRQLARGIAERLAWMRRLLPGPRRNGREYEDQVVGTLACMIGGVILGRAVAGKDSEAVLASCRRFLHRTLDEAERRSTSP